LGEGKFDLFGLPERPGRGEKGRPAFQVTEKDRNKIKLLLALGWSNQRVANALDISAATLKRYFRAELAKRDAMRDRLDARRIEVMADEAFKGNTSAMRTLGALIDRSDAMERVRNIGEPKPENEAKAEAPGKKVLKQVGAAGAIASDPDLFGAAPTKH
jgi:hypothetical protein